MLHLAVLHGQAGCGATGRLPPHQPERGNAARSRPQCAAAKSGCRPARPIALGHRRPPIQSRDRQRGPARRCPSMRPSSPLALHETPAPQCPPHEGCTGWGALTGQKKKANKPRCCQAGGRAWMFVASSAAWKSCLPRLTGYYRVSQVGVSSSGFQSNKRSAAALRAVRKCAPHSLIMASIPACHPPSRSILKRTGCPRSGFWDCCGYA